MNIDLHNHTKRCKHADGECEEYIQAAIVCGIDIFGFADHAPMKFDERYRMDIDEVESYIDEVSHLREIYKDKIDIRVGFEVDYIHKKEYLIEPKVLNSDVDYLIGSVHFLNNWGFDNEEFLGVYKNVDINKIWIEYLDSIANMAQSGYFDIVGHFDLLKIFNNKPHKELQKYIINALESIKDNNMVIEINTAGLRKMIKEIYPSYDILQLVHKMEIPITFSSDAHNPTQVGFMKDSALNLAKKIGFNKVVSFKKREREIYDF
ncbi:histidinol phosphate phosphatase [Helicobacter sp. 16-1353]|uniref:histidinol-phosphatase n=1 Tax=Helicobacter sp. 16-1353 TaxID=2004996 RepID=UPI000DCBB8E7|nr:histidinol-phosphatase [Helicobacter sp. 16-1353]RAX52247.1 histidinol phosphate phosphatase [Helicobacter sp. 16-1353]